MDSVEQTLQILSNATGTNTELLNIKVSPGVGDIVVQLDVFNEQSEKPKPRRQSSTESINFNSHLEVFQTIMQQVTKTPNEKTFLIILQHLLRIDPIEPLSDLMWKVVEKLVHRATQLENSEEAERIVNSTITHTFSCQNCRAGVKDKENIIENKAEIKASLTSLSKACNPPSPPLTGLNLSPPAPPIPPQPPAAPRLPPPPPPPLQGNGPPLPPPPNPLSQPNNLLLPQQNAPRASRKLKTFNWTKIPPHKIMNKLNIWTIMANDRQYKCVELIDFKGIEGLFALQTTNKTIKNVDVVDGMAPRDQKLKEPKHIHLLDAQRSLKVNIFLSQFKGYNSEDIVQLILTGDCKIMNLERLKDLKKFFENEDEILLLKNFAGDRQRLASAEKFLISMLDLSNFRLRIESLILKEEFQLNVTYLEPCLNDIIQAGNNLMKSKTLQEILGVIIIIGNFLNSGGYAGNAAGIKLSSLTKLTEIKANKTGMHLLHLIAMEVQKYNPELLDVSNELNFLESVSKLNNDQIEKDIKDMELALDSIKKEIYSPTTDEDIKQQMNEFIKNSGDKMEILKKQIAELKTLRIEMADFFCEDLTTFKVDECFEIFYKFCEQFKQALKENDRRRQLEMQATIRQKQKEDQLAQKALTGFTTPSKSNAHLPPTRLCLRSPRESFEGNNTDFNINSKKNEDDLMEFLQNSNRKRYRETETIRKRRLDKRPDLLKFNFERERDQHSPNLAESSNENTPTKCNGISEMPALEDQKKRNLIQKSWKRLMEGYRASQMRDSSLTPDISSKRERLQIFIRSNSVVDNISGQPKKQTSINIIKTPLPKTSGVFNFSLKEIQASQAEIIGSRTENYAENNSKSLDVKSPLPLATSQNKEIADGMNATPSHEESNVEMRRPRIKLKTMASIVELGCRYSSINEEDLKTTIKKLRTPTVENSQFCFSPTTLKCNNWNWEHSQQVLNSVGEEKSLLKVNENLKDTNKEQQQTDVKPFQAEVVPENYLKTIESEKSEDRTAVSPAQKEIAQENFLKTSELENKVVAKQESEECCHATSVIVIEKETITDQIKTKENFSKRFASKLQKKIRALSPSRPEEQHKTLPQNEGTKKSFVSRLQSKIRGLSPLQSQTEQVANFQSYVNMEKEASNSSIVKSRNQDGFKPHPNASIAKESISKQQCSSKDNKNQLRLSQPNSRISLCSTKTNNSSKELLGPPQITQITKTPGKSPYQDTNTSGTVKPALSRKSPSSCKNKQSISSLAKAKQSPTSAQNETNPKKIHCQNLSASNSCKKTSTNLQNLAPCRKLNQTKSVSSTNSTSKFEVRRLSFQPNTNSSASDQRRLSNTLSNSLPKRRSSLSSKIVRAQSTTGTTVQKTTSKITNSKQTPSKINPNVTTSASTIPTKFTKSRDPTTKLKETLKNAPNPPPALLTENYSTSTSGVRRSSLQSNFAPRSQQLKEMTGKSDLFSNTSPNKTLNEVNSSSTTRNNLVKPDSTSVSPTATSHTMEHNFKRPCKKVK